MIRILLFFICICNVQLFTSTTDFLRGCISSKDKRYATFKYAFDLMEERHVRTLVETGTARHGCSSCQRDGCSTLLFAHYAAVHQSCLYSVDINKNALQCAEEAIKPYLQNVVLQESDSVAFLRDFPYEIDFLYLDSYDFDLNCPDPSQQHHLNEIIAAYPHLTENSIVLIDDCGLPFGGKGKLVIEYLLEHGWKIVAQGYQILLVKND